MHVADRIERALGAALTPLSSPESPPTLVAAVRHAVFPGGARIRPRLCLAVSAACGDPAPALAEAAAAAIELIHCASLVHDDLPCFDDAPLRRGLPSVHAAYGEPIAVLAGDQLIALAFEVLARTGLSEPAHALRAVRLSHVVARGLGMPLGIIAGQGWESEPRIPMATYRRAKTGALFEAAALAGAIAAGEDAGPWRTFGQRIGEGARRARASFSESSLTQVRISSAWPQGGTASTASSTRSRSRRRVPPTPSWMATFGRPSAPSRPTGLPISSGSPVTSSRSSASWYASPMR